MILHPSAEVICSADVSMIGDAATHPVVVKVVFKLFARVALVSVSREITR
ncbi:MAG: hypothetical protein WCK88_01240 [bacterium]